MAVLEGILFLVIAYVMLRLGLRTVTIGERAVRRLKADMERRRAEKALFILEDIDRVFSELPRLVLACGHMRHAVEGVRAIFARTPSGNRTGRAAEELRAARASSEELMRSVIECAREGHRCCTRYLQARAEPEIVVRRTCFALVEDCCNRCSSDRCPAAECLREFGLMA